MYSLEDWLRREIGLLHRRLIEKVTLYSERERCSSTLIEVILSKYSTLRKTPALEGYTDGEAGDDEYKKARLHWALTFSNLIAQWAQWLANIVLGSGSFLKRLLPPNHNGLHRTNISFSLSPLQEERLKNLQQRLEVPFDGNYTGHQDALKCLWRLAYPDKELPPLKSELWKEMGWQGTDPSTDFRGGGYVSLENLIFFAKTYPLSMRHSDKQLANYMSSL